MQLSQQEIPQIPERTNVLVVSYLTIRRAIGVSGLLLPLALVLGGWFAGVPIQDNMSSYYHTPLRDIFVGMLTTRINMRLAPSSILLGSLI